jgi:hypothetical protein
LTSRARRAALALLFVALAWAALPTFRDWLSVRRPALLRLDYALYYASSVQGQTAGWHRLYDLEAQREVFQRISPDLWWFPNVYTPVLAVVMVPFTHLSLEAGYAVWSGILLLCAILSWSALAPGDRPLRGVQLAMLFVPYPVALGLWLGQVVAVQAAAVALCFVLLRRGHELAAGAALAVMALKPQTLFLVPFALLAAGRRKAFLGWALCMALIAAAAVALIGIDGARAYAERLRYAHDHAQEFWVAWSYTLTRRFEGPARIAVQLAVAATALLAAWRNRSRPEIALAAGLLGSLLATPFLHLNDHLLLFPAAWLVLRAFPSVGAVVPLLLGYVLLCLCTPQNDVWARWLPPFEAVWLAALAVARPEPSAQPRISTA